MYIYIYCIHPYIYIYVYLYIYIYIYIYIFVYIYIYLKIWKANILFKLQNIFYTFRCFLDSNQNLKVQLKVEKKHLKNKIANCREENLKMQLKDKNSEEKLIFIIMKMIR